MIKAMEQQMKQQMMQQMKQGPKEFRQIHPKQKKQGGTHDESKNRSTGAGEKED
jgi:hypothetical protein